MKYEWWNLPDDPNRVGDDDYKPNVSLTFRDEDEEYQFYLDQREPIIRVPDKPLSCGAKVWIETLQPIEIIGDYDV